MKTGKPELLVDYECETGESPLWHSRENKLYWLDIPRGRLLWYEPQSGNHGIALETEPIGGFTIQTDGGILLFMARCAVMILLDGQLSTVIKSIPEESETRFNDVIADTRGRVFAGTMTSGTRHGRLYQISTNGSYRVVSNENYGTPNGMGFAPDRKQMYFNDSRASRTYIFNYHEENGDLTERNVFIERPREEGRGDGLTVDSVGNIWMGKWDGGRVVCYSPEGRLLHEIPLPARKVSSMTFGGKNCTDLYITTALHGTREEEGAGAGALFRVRTDVRGVPEFQSSIQLGL